MTFKTPTRLLIFSAVACVTFVMTLIVLNYWESERTTLVLSDKELEQTTFLNQIVELAGNSLKTVSVDFGRWDEMAKFAMHPDTQWARTNIDGSMPVYDIDAAWIFTGDLRLLYSFNRVNDPQLIRGLPMFQQVASVLPKRPYMHFFAATTKGLMEIRSAPIRWQTDSLKTSSSLGYFMVGRIWNQGYLEKLSLLTGSTLTLKKATELQRDPINNDSCAIAISKPLVGPDGMPAAVLLGQVEVASLEDLANLSKRETIAFIVFAVCVLMMSALSYSSLVRKPLALITASLRTKNPAMLRDLELRNNEFGEIASMIVEFFAQKSRLEKEISERTRIQEALTESEEKMNQWLDSLQEVVWVTDLQSRCLYLNDAASRLFGRDKRELLGQTLSEMQLPQQAKKDSIAFARVLEGEVLSDYEMELLRKDGTRIAILLSAKRLLDRDGNVIGASGTAWDVTKRRQMEGALAESEERFRTLVGNIPGVVYRCEADAQYTMRYLSPEILNLCGAPAEDFVGNHVRSFADIIFPDDREILSNAIATAQARRESFTVEYRVLTVDGSVRWVHEQGKPIFDQNGKTAWIDGVLLDITDRKQVQQMIRDLEERNKQILNAIAELIVVRGPNDNIVWANQAFLNFHNLTLEKLSQCERDFAGNGDADVFRFGVMADIPEEALKRHDNELRIFHTVTSPIFDADGKTAMVVSVSRDITDKRLTEDAQHLSEQYFRTMIENASDLITVFDIDGRIRYQNPAVTTILGYALHEQALKRFDEYVHPDDQETMKMAFSESLAGQQAPRPVRCRSKHKNGSWVTLESVGRAALDPHGRPVVVASSRSVDENMRVEETLRESQSYLQAVFNTVQAGILIVNTETNSIIDANLAALSLIGSSMDQIIGLRLDCFILSNRDTLHPSHDAERASDRQRATLIRADGVRIPIYQSAESAMLHEHQCFVMSFVLAEPERGAPPEIPAPQHAPHQAT
jgi:PAS domain S-box-containing protein